MNILVIIGIVAVVFVFFIVTILKSRRSERRLGYKDRASLDNIIETTPFAEIQNNDSFTHTGQEGTNLEWNMPQENNVEQNVAEPGNKYLSTGIKLIKDQNIGMRLFV